MAHASRSIARIFGWPAIIALISAFGLTSALLSDGIWDVASWVALALPPAVVIFFLVKRER